MKFLSTCLCALLISACVAGSLNSSPPLRIEGMVIENQTRTPVSAVRLMVPVTGSFVSCGNISANSMCSTSFPETDYTGNPVEITWSQGGQIYSTGLFAIELPNDLKAGKSAAVRVVIAGPGSAGAMIVQ